MKLRHLSLLLLAVLACAAAQSDNDIPYENDNQFPPDNISEPEGDVLNESEDIVYDTTTQPSDQPADDSTLSAIETDTPTTETPNTDITTETSNSPVEETTQEEFVTSENEIASNTTEASVDAVDELAVTEISTSEEPVNEDVTTETTAVDELAATEISTSEEPVNEDVTTDTTTPLIEDVPSPELEVQEAIEEVTLAEPVETVSMEPTETQAEEVLTTEPDVATSEKDTNGEPVDADATDLSVAVDQDNQDQEEPIDAATTESSSLDEDVSFPTIANETDVGASNDSGTDVAKFSVFLAEDVQLPTTELGLKETSEVGTFTENVLDVTTESSVPLTVDEQLPTDESDVIESTDIASSKPLDVSTTEAAPLVVNEELPTTELEENNNTTVDKSETTLDGSVIAKNNLQTTQTNEELLNNGETVTPVTPIDPSEFSIRSNKARYDLEAVSPLTLVEAPKEVVAPQEVDLPKDTKADNKVEDVNNKVEDVSVGATTSVNKAGGIDKSVIAVIVAGMVVVVAGITIKKNWKSIKNKFSSSPRPANDRANHTNGIAPEEVPLQEKDSKNPSPV